MPRPYTELHFNKSTILTEKENQLQTSSQTTGDCTKLSTMSCGAVVIRLI
jgi:hypothetical protein